MIRVLFSNLVSCVDNSCPVLRTPKLRDLRTSGVQTAGRSRELRGYILQPCLFDKQHKFHKS